MPEVEWRRMRADQLREAARSDAIVIVPVASLEQHGPHLPVEVDSLLGETVAIRTAGVMAAAGTPALVTPVVWTGVSEHHMSFGGTITLNLPEFSAVIEGVVRSIVRHGFRRIVLLNSHGGNENALRWLTDELTPKYRVPLVQFSYWTTAAEAIAPLLDTQRNVLHACEMETAMMLAVRPDLVATDRIPLAHANTTPDVEDIAPGVYRWRTIGAVSSSGVVGNPEAATPEKGERLFAAIAQAVAAKLMLPELWSLPWDHERLS